MKKVFLFFIAIITIVLVAAAFLPKEFSAERSIEINQSNEIVYAYLHLLKNQENYSVWGKIDPKIKKSFKGIDGKVGFVSTWKSKKESVGAGSQEIIKLVKNQRIDTKLRFTSPFESESDSRILTQKINKSKTKVSWRLKGSFPYPVNIFLLITDMDKELGKELVNGLKNLKLVLK